jgi:hypothetical protein
MALQRLKEAGERAKMELSTAMRLDINLLFITADQSGPKHLNMKLTRAKLEALCDLIDRLDGPAAALRDAGLSASQVDEVLLVGGMTCSRRCRRGEEDLRQGAQQGRESGRGRRDRRRHPGRRAQGRGGRTSSSSTSPRCRSASRPGGVFTKLIEKKHHHPHQEGPDLLDRGRQPVGG